MKIHYLYKITHIDSGRYYFGKRSFNGTDPSEDRYMGSGTLICRAVKKYGKEAFKKEILQILPNLEALNEAERRLITEKIIHDTLCLNIATGGGGGNLGSKVIEKLRLTASTPEFRANVSAGVNNPVVKAQIIKTMKETMSDPTWKEKFSKIQKDAQNRPEEKIRNSRAQKSAQNRDDVIEKKRIRMLELFQTEEIKEKHKQSCNSDSFREAQRNKTSGTVWINKDGQKKYVKEEDLGPFLAEGWSLGMGPRKKKD